MSTEKEDRLPDGRVTKVLTGWKSWLPLYAYRTQSGWKFQIQPVLLVTWCFLLVATGYLGAGTALFFNDKYGHKLENISWVDRIYPPNWDKYRRARGDSYISKAQSSLDDGEFSAAFHQVRAGLSRSPQNQDGRLILTEMYLAMGRADLAQTTLIDGIDFHSADINYLRRTIQSLFSTQRDEDVVNLCDNLLNRSESNHEIEQLLSLAKANALFYRGNFDQAEDALETDSIRLLAETRLLRARIEWDRGFPELALASIKQLTTEFPANQEIYRHQVKWLIDQNLGDIARGTSLVQRIRYPDQSHPRIDLLYALDELDETEEIIKDAYSLLREFGDDYAAILQLGDFAANTGRIDIALKVSEHANARDMPLEGPALMLVEAMITAGEYHRALGQTQQVLTDHPDWEERMAPVFNGLQAICYHALGEREEANLFLDNYLGLESLRAENLVAVSNRLETVGATREARMVLDNAVRRDPLNQAALTRLIELDLESTNAPELPENLQRILEMRRPPTSLLREAYDKLGQDRFIFVENRGDVMEQLLNKLTG